MFNLEANKQV